MEQASIVLEHGLQTTLRDMLAFISYFGLAAFRPPSADCSWYRARNRIVHEWLRA